MPFQQDGAQDLTHDQVLLLVHMAKKVNSSIDLDEILHFATQATQEICRSQASSILLLDEATGELVFRIAEGTERDKVKEIRLSPDTGIAGHVVRTGEAMLVEDVYNSPYFTRQVDSETGFKTKSMICVPLQSREGDTLGCLEVINHVDGRPFQEDDVQLCEAVAAQAAIAIENARLVEAKVEAEGLAVIGQSIMGVAHCVKNILNGIEGGGFILEQSLQKEDLVNARKGWEMLGRHKARLKELVMEMLYVSKKREPELEPTDVGRIVREACELMEEKAKEADVALSVSVPEEMSFISADAKALFRCVLNLIGNAIDACRESEARQVAVSLSQDPSGSVITIAVRDSGTGFPEHILQRPFVPFQSTKGSKGTGLGLYTTKRMIEDQGGFLRIENVSDGGACVRIVLNQAENPLQTSRPEVDDGESENPRGG